MNISKKIIVSGLMAGSIISTQALALSTDKEKLSYTVGIQLGQTLQRQNMDLDAKALTMAISDMMSGKKPQLSLEDMQAQLDKERDRQVVLLKEKQKAATATGNQFLADNKKKENVKTLDTGLQYIIEKEGKGDSPKAGSNVTVHYRGSLLDGTEFDSSYARGEPATFGLDNVIPGFKAALSMMKPGAKWKVFIPSDLGYGERGAPPKIGPNQVLIFDIELIESK